MKIIIKLGNQMIKIERDLLEPVSPTSSATSPTMAESNTLTRQLVNDTLQSIINNQAGMTNFASHIRIEGLPKTVTSEALHKAFTEGTKFIFKLLETATGVAYIHEQNGVVYSDVVQACQVLNIGFDNLLDDV